MCLLKLYCCFFRYELPILFIVMNNNGIYSGLDQESWSNVDRTYQLGIRYSKKLWLIQLYFYNNNENVFNIIM